MELLVVGAIVLVVAAIVAVAIIRSAVDTRDQALACEQEYGTVQAGLYAYMVRNSLTAVPASTGTDMTAPVPLYVKGASATNASYVPYPRTKWTYTWDGTGRITGIAGSNVPFGCVVNG